MSDFYYVYVLRSGVDSSFYIGSTSNLERRLKEHHSDRRSYAYRKAPWVLVYYEAYRSKRQARRREYKLKKSSWHKQQVLNRLKEEDLGSI